MLAAIKLLLCYPLGPRGSVVRGRSCGHNGCEWEYAPAAGGSTSKSISAMLSDTRGQNHTSQSVVPMVHVNPHKRLAHACAAPQRKLGRSCTWIVAQPVDGMVSVASANVYHSQRSPVLPRVYLTRDAAVPDQCWQGNKRIVKFLLRKGASMNVQNHDGNTVLHFCHALGRQARSLPWGHDE